MRWAPRCTWTSSTAQWRSPTRSTPTASQRVSWAAAARFTSRLPLPMLDTGTTRRWSAPDPRRAHGPQVLRHNQQAQQLIVDLLRRGRDLPLRPCGSSLTTPRRLAHDRRYPGSASPYWIMCAAPPVQDWQQAARQLQEDGWQLHAIPTQTAASWLNLGGLADVTGHAVRTPRACRTRPTASGGECGARCSGHVQLREPVGGRINDTLPLGLLNELLGVRVPIVVAMYCTAALVAHPAYRPNIRRLQHAGATVLQGTLDHCQPGGFFLDSDQRRARRAPARTTRSSRTSRADALA